MSIRLKLKPNFLIEITKVEGGWSAECPELGTTHIRTTLAAAVIAVTIEIHDHESPYED